MKVGVHLPQWGADATRSGVLSVARCAEDAGLDTLWVADHVVYPAHSSSRYPYREDGTPFTAEDGFLEALTTLAVVAGQTDRIRLGTSVLVLPQREVLLAAKTLATLDVLSEGRTVFAVGAGWWQEEFAALGVEFEGRGRRFDEQLTALKELWSTGRGQSHGTRVHFDEVVCLPRPVQPGGPRLLIGGNGKVAWRRVATRGDGWHAVGLEAEELAHGMTQISRLAEQAGRDPSELTLSTSTGIGRSAERARSKLLSFVNAGVDELALNFAGAESAPALCEAIERFTDGPWAAVRQNIGR